MEMEAITRALMQVPPQKQAAVPKKANVRRNSADVQGVKVSLSDQLIVVRISIVGRALAFRSVRFSRKLLISFEFWA